jgi:cytochrome c-type biogenesis protein CcmH/NrfG
MNLLSLVFGLPLAPVRLVVAVARAIQQRAEEDLAHPAVARRELEELEEAYEAGEVSEDEMREAEAHIARRVAGEQPPLPPAGGDPP